jgi:hypothetical protein
LHLRPYNNAVNDIWIATVHSASRAIVRLAAYTHFGDYEAIEA